MAGFNFLGLPLEIRNMIYRQLLAIDHNSGNWEWSIASLGRFNQRHGIIRVNSQIRCEAQRCLYGSIPWVLRIHCHDKDHWELEERKVIAKILSKLTAAQSSYIRELSLVYIIGDDIPARYSRNYILFVCKHLPAVQRLNIRWYDHNISTTWDVIEIEFLEPLAALRNVSSVFIRERKGTFRGGPKDDGEFAKCVSDIVAKELFIRDSNSVWPCGLLTSK